MPNPIDLVFHGLFSAVDPLGMVLRTLMALLSDALAQVSTDMYQGVFDVTTVDFQQAAVGNIWRITTGLSATLVTVLLVIAAFRSMFAQSSRYLMAALPGVVLALVGPQALAVLLPAASMMTTSMANAIVASATPDLAASIRLLAGVGDNAIYEGLGLLAPLIAAMLLFGLTTVFFVLMFCMVAAVVLYVLSPFAFAGLVMAPTRTWFTKWATTLFSVLFAKVPIAILLALAVSLFANSAHAGVTQSFANAAAGLILGLGALLAPLMAYGLFSFMSTVAVRPTIPITSPSQAIGSTYYGAQMGKSGVNGLRTVMSHTRAAATTSTAGGPGTGPATSGPVSGPAADGPPGTPGPTSAGPTPTGPGPAPRSAATPASASGAPGTATGTVATGARSTAPAAASSAGPVSSAGTAGATGSAGAAAGAATGGITTVAVIAADTAQTARQNATDTATRLSSIAPDSGTAGDAAPSVDARRTTE